MTGKKILARIAQAIVVLLITYTVAFVLLQALPSDAILARYASPDLGLSEKEIAEIRSEYGADKPLIQQYILALGGYLTGNFGYSIQTGTSVSSLLATALPSTLALAVCAFLLALILALGIATLANISSTLRGFFRGLPPLMISVPSFWIGIILIQLLSFRLALIPVINANPIQALILPVITLSIPIAAPLAQVLIRTIDDINEQPFITVSKARGASTTWIFFRDVLRNALLPVSTMAGVLFGELVGGAVVTEAVFGRTGIGQLTLSAVSHRDMPVLLAIVLISASTYILINLIVDLSYPLIDPRLRRKARP
ncbi:ABC transporter permease [Corynebacterium sp. sy017]|uniref:ABC transporter permease n=1 Tax=unclassified Corynebacterium TaxID=2624378 RepID=UPI0011851EF6|nr:ABC transporter permease [Corynebacterium sp. SY003]MBP3088540.1 ABC transporter permease [Corynebacterium sp. sy017]TSD92095.1 ABC transporter permease [Corynebacterium sp. SY003]